METYAGPRDEGLRLMNLNFFRGSFDAFSRKVGIDRRPQIARIYCLTAAEKPEAATRGASENSSEWKTFVGVFSQVES
jgi:hypothetical protein